MFLKRIGGWLVAVIVTTVYWLLSRLWFFEHVRYPKPKNPASPRIYAHWHGDELALVRACQRWRMAVMASRSKDGELMRRVLSWLGYHVVRGSSSRGGVGGLKGLIDAATKGGFNASLAVDGPRGPIYKVKPGILKLAQQTQLPIVPGACAASRRFIFKKAWNRCYLPLPFSKCVIVYGEPMKVPALLTDAEFEALRQKLEQTLIALKEEAELHFSRSLVISSPRVPEPSGV